MSILLMREAIVARLRADLELDDKFIQEHRRATFTSSDLNPAIKNTPLSLRVSFGGSDLSEWSADEVDLYGLWSVYIIACEKPGAERQPRDETLLTAVPLVLAVVTKADWDSLAGYEELGTRSLAERARVLPIYEGDYDGASALIWAVQWRELLVIPPEPSDDLRALKKLISRYDLAPKEGVIDAEDVINMGKSA